MLSAELNRRKEPLEAYPLDSMTMVGSVSRGVPTALLRVDNLLYQVKVGDHLGQNYGRISHIDETEVKLREIVQDAAGEWIEREAALQLQDRVRAERRASCTKYEYEYEHEQNSMSTALQSAAHGPDRRPFGTAEPGPTPEERLPPCSTGVPRLPH